MKKINYLLILFLLVGCKQNNRFQIDTSKNKIDVKIERFDLGLINLDTTNIQNSTDSLKKSFPLFANLFANEVMFADSINSVSAQKDLVNFLKYPNIKQVNDKVLKQYSSSQDIEKELSESFTYIHHYFPKIQLPKVLFFVSGLNKKKLYNGKVLGIGIDFYLGADFPIYKKTLYDYQLDRLKKEQITIDVILTILSHNIPFYFPKDRLLENMLYRGKLLYLTSVFAPKKTEKQILGYNDKQWKWATENEKNIWKAIVGKKDLFSSKQQLISSYINDAPFTMPISQDSPPRLGDFIGYQIIKSYMQKNKKVGLLELVKAQNSQQILSKSHY